MANYELLDRERSIVAVIDLQGKLMEMIHRPRLVIDATIRLMQLAEVFEVPVILTEQYPQGLGVTHPEVRAAFDQLSSPKQYVDKLSFGCCGEPRFMEALEAARPGLPPDKRQVVVCGIEAHVCVMQTVLELLRLEHGVFACWEAISGRGEEYYRHALRRMSKAGAQITNHESVCFEWARDSTHPGFKAMNRILRAGQLT
ncbi:MAG: isochorismatase family protein [Anaerolineae bacterium]|nr:isochorismatase family protein [Anaerolineae bacterium]